MLRVVVSRLEWSARAVRVIMLRVHARRCYKTFEPHCKCLTKFVCIKIEIKKFVSQFEYWANLTLFHHGV